MRPPKLRLQPNPPTAIRISFPVGRESRETLLNDFNKHLSRSFQLVEDYNVHHIVVPSKNQAIKVYTYLLSKNIEFFHRYATKEIDMYHAYSPYLFPSFKEFMKQCYGMVTKLNIVDIPTIGM